MTVLNVLLLSNIIYSEIKLCSETDVALFRHVFFATLWHSVTVSIMRIMFSVAW